MHNDIHKDTLLNMSFYFQISTSTTKFDNDNNLPTTFPAFVTVTIATS